MPKFDHRPEGKVGEPCSVCGHKVISRALAGGRFSLQHGGPMKVKDAPILGMDGEALSEAEVAVLIPPKPARKGRSMKEVKEAAIEAARAEEPGLEGAKVMGLVSKKRRKPKAQEAAGSGLFCPTDREHGQLVAIDVDGSTQYHCPHSDHNGRSKRHKLGEAPQTRSTWTLTEAEAAQGLPQTEEEFVTLVEGILEGV